MIAPVTALSRLIATAMDDLGLSTREVARRSGGVFGHATVNKYRNGQEPRRPDDHTLRAFSHILHIPLRTLYDAVGVDEPLEDWVPPPEANRLTREQREVLTRLIKLLAAGNEGRAVAQETPAESENTTTTEQLRAWRLGSVDSTPRPAD